MERIALAEWYLEYDALGEPVSAARVNESVPAAAPPAPAAPPATA